MSTATAPHNAPSMPLATFFESVYVPKRVPHMAPNTRRLYEGHLFILLRRHLQREPVVADLTEDMIAGFLGAEQARGVSLNTLDGHRNRLMALANFAYRRRLLDELPSVPAPPKVARVPQAWTVEEIGRLMDACPLMRGEHGGVPAPLWWRALLEVAWQTGERISAIMALRWANVDLPTGWLVYPAEIRKGGRADKGHKLSDDARRLLAAIREPERELVFPFEHHVTSLWNDFRRLVKHAGLPDQDGNGFHRLRRSTASYICRAGGNPSLILGHADPRVTTRCYLDPRIASPDAAVDLLPKLPTEITPDYLELPTLPERCEPEVTANRSESEPTSEPAPEHERTRRAAPAAGSGVTLRKSLALEATKRRREQRDKAQAAIALRPPAELLAILDGETMTGADVRTVDEFVTHRGMMRLEAARRMGIRPSQLKQHFHIIGDGELSLLWHNRWRVLFGLEARVKPSKPEPARPTEPETERPAKPKPLRAMIEAGERITVTPEIAAALAAPVLTSETLLLVITHLGLLGHRQQELADLLNVPTTWLSGAKVGQRKTSAQWLPALRMLYGLSIGGGA